MNTITSLFEHSTQMTAFLTCLSVGLVYILVSSLLGALFGHDGDSHSDGGSDADHDGDNHSTISIFSPKIIAIFAMGLGGGGAIATVYGFSFSISIIFGLALGLGLGALFVVGLNLLHRQQASSEVQTSAAIGQFATIATGFGPNGVGEANLSVRGQYMTYFVRSQSNKPVAKGSLVKVIATDGGTLIVE